MKEFDINLAKQGHPVCTRDGRPVRIVCFDVKNNELPILALIIDARGEEYGEQVARYRNDGSWGETSNKDCCYDLMLAPVKHEGWVNVLHGKNGYYVDKEIWVFEENAKEIGKEFAEYVTTVKIEWRE